MWPTSAAPVGSGDLAVAELLHDDLRHGPRTRTLDDCLNRAGDLHRRDQGPEVRLEFGIGELLARHCKMNDSERVRTSARVVHHLLGDVLELIDPDVASEEVDDGTAEEINVLAHDWQCIHTLETA